MFQITNASFTKLHLRSMPLLSLQQTKRRSCVLTKMLIQAGQTNISGSCWPEGSRNDEILETFGSFQIHCPSFGFIRLDNQDDEILEAPG